MSCFRFVPIVLGLFVISVLPAQEVQSERIQGEKSQGAFLGNISPLRDLDVNAAPQLGNPSKVWHRHNYFYHNPQNNQDPLPRNGDPLVSKKKDSPEGQNPQLTLFLDLEGLSDPNIVPPDPTGEVGKDHYVQMINAPGGAALQIWDKDGNVVLQPTPTSTIWSQVGSGSIGDPIIQYDPGAERWLMAEMQGFFQSELLLAISDNSDPTGSWKAYRFGTQGFPDYPKLYVWNDSYFFTANEISGGNKCAGYALDRDAILSGAPSFDLYRFEFPNFMGIQYQPAVGADWEGSAAPPPGSPAYIFRVYDDSWNGGSDQLQVWEVHTDWDTPGNNFTEGPLQLFPTPFETRVCFGTGLFDCIEQPNTSTRITALENIIMYKASYRNFGTHESVVFNHVSDVSGQVGAGGDAAIRWYELRKEPGQDWYIYQEGTYAPDLVTNRFMSNLAMDELGNIALGYTAASEFEFPGVRLTGRRVGDPLNEMTIEEFVLIEGKKSSNSARWGDYSVMSVDPEDGRTFWFTSEYMPEQGMSGTRIAKFTIQRDTFDVSPQALLEPQPSAMLGDNETISVEVVNSGLVPAFDFDLNLWYEGNDIVTETVTDTIQPGETYMHTFTPTVSLSIPGNTYLIEVISQWAPDSFEKNDTLRVNFKRPTENDAAYGGRSGLPGQVCSSEYTFDFLLENASGLPMTEAKIIHRINTQPWDTISWTGNLAPGEREAVPVLMTDIQDGLNLLRAFTELPNNLQDEDVHNDSMLVKFQGNLDGTTLEMEATTDVGILNWAVKDQVGGVLASGQLDGGEQFADICADNNQCYTLAVSSETFTWEGNLTIYDIFGNVLISIGYANQEEQIYEFCTPERKIRDVGAIELLSPASSPDLGTAEPISILFRNFGLNGTSGVEVAWQIDGGGWNTDSYPNPINPGETVQFDFAGTADLGNEGQIYQVDIRAVVGGDQDTDNDAKTFMVQHMAALDAEASALEPFEACADTAEVSLLLLMRNVGFDTIHSLTLEINSNGNIQTIDESNAFMVAPGETLEYYFHPHNVQIGANSCEITITAVNGMPGDGNAGNNTRMTNYFIDPTKTPYRLELVLDGFPEQTTWELQDENGMIELSGGSYTEAFESIVDNWCLESAKCYSFILRDTAGDGMLGIVSLYKGDEKIWDNGGAVFTDSLQFDFCTDDLCSGFDLSTENVGASGPGVPDGEIAVVPLGGTPPYQYSLDGSAFQNDSIFTGLEPAAYTVVCQDLNQCVDTIVVNLGTVSAGTPTSENSLKISPNPTSGMVQISLLAETNDLYAMAELMNLDGKVLQAARLYRWNDHWKGTLALETYPSGAYVVRVRSKAGVYERIIVRK